ncbi:MAG: hypothetical protein ACOY0T_14885 [Myxococcota bacterium]
MIIAAALVTISLLFEVVVRPIIPRLHLGAEYYCIGLSLADGRGFSDAFGEATGPTAWMPPIYPAFLGLVIKLVGTKNGVAGCIAVLMAVSVAIQGVSVHAIASRCFRKISPWVATGIFFVWVLTFHYWFFELTSDVWLLCLVVNCTTLAAVHHVVSGEVKVLAWGALGGIGALISPTLAFAWGCLVLFFAARQAANRARWARVLLVGACIVLPWTVRNAVVFDKFIPTKSNLMFEAYQANVMDEDGIYDVSSMVTHPYNSLKVRFEYQKLGEIGFIARHGARFRNQLAANPAGFLRRIANRAVAATVRYVPISERMDPPFERRLIDLLYPIPFVCMLLSLWMNGPQRALLRVLSFFWCCYLLPYVVVAFYVRYYLPLTPLMVTSIGLTIDQCAALYAQRRERAASGPVVAEGQT